MGGKFRHRLTGAKFKTRVPKGMSSESNPAKSRYRDAAKAVRLNGQTPLIAVDDQFPTASTTEDKNDLVLEQIPLDAMSLGGNDNEEAAESSTSRLDEVRTTLSNGTELTHYSGFTTCTNPNFDVVHRIWKSGSNLQSDVVAVLAAVTELIKEKGGTETDTEYFAALLSALESTPKEETERIGATAYLLSLIIKKIGKDILQSTFSQTCKVLTDKLAEQCEEENAVALKNIIQVLGFVLRAQSISIWQFANNKNLLVSISQFVMHEKPWVRTMARRVVRSILTDPVKALENGLHPAAGSIGQFVGSRIEEIDDTSAARMLCLLEGILYKMPSDIFGRIAVSILKLTARPNGSLKCTALQCLQRTLQQQPSDVVLPVDWNAELIERIRECAPPTNDVAVCAYWMQALTEAHVCLSTKNSQRSRELLPETITVIVKVFDSANDALGKVAHSIIARLIDFSVKQNGPAGVLFLTKLGEALSLPNASVWKYILKSYVKLFEIVGSALVGGELKSTLKTLAELRESDECFCKGDLDMAIGAAVRNIGIPTVLEAIPLDIDVASAILATHFRRSWILPVLRVNIQRAPLAYFIRVFLPLAHAIHRRLAVMEPLTKRLYTTIESQIWDLLPSFCSSASDFEVSFKEFAPLLGTAINERPDIRPVLLSALRSSLRFALQPDAPAERRAVLENFAKNFMPILFNLYSMTDEEQSGKGYDINGCRLAALETIRLYVELTPDDLLERFTGVAVDKCSDDGNVLEVKLHMMDILSALCSSANIASLNRMLTAVQSYFDQRENPFQKKAFRVLEEIFKRRSEKELEEFFNDNVDVFDNVISLSLECVSPPARGALTSIYRYIIANFETYDDLKAFIVKVIVQVVLCLDKENNRHTRANAAKVFQDMCSRLTELRPVDGETISLLDPILTPIYEIITPASGEESQATSLQTSRSTLVALNIVAQKYIRLLNASALSRLVAHACTWINDGRPPVRLLAIRLLRMLVTKMPGYALHQFREIVMQSTFGQVTADVTHRVRKANRLLLEALVERFGGAEVARNTTKPEWLKQLKNIEKLARKKARQQNGEVDMSEDEDESDDERSAVSSTRTAGADTILGLLDDSDEEPSDDETGIPGGMRRAPKTAGSVWLREGDDDNMMDLLDKKSLIEKVTTSKPVNADDKKPREIKLPEEFKFDKKGRLVIEEILEKPKKSRKRPALDDFEESDGESDADSDAKQDDKKSVAKSYKSGGVGIHRKLGSGNDSKQKPKHSRPMKKPVKKSNIQPYEYIPLRKKKKGKKT
ncbi:hypothetical protein QR680_018336 [Steinernema hermaphroditum]|uniref:Ribosomal RNA-processing protein 12-like conserved domain-containing protein n=1 Tax=Steinernema hermaphroditum TaxID=289476 RepID=A0AA39HJV8_9BILA|nr:hypothetical protein QR680_018336 [Steinernema hermaphroditum]